MDGGLFVAECFLLAFELSELVTEELVVLFASLIATGPRSHWGVAVELTSSSEQVELSLLGVLW